MTLPGDTFMLLSFINMKLRDGEYEDLADLCKSLDWDENLVISRLKDEGFEYNEATKQFR